jgi:multiple sugar transport system ATP-binding protein
MSYLVLENVTKNFGAVTVIHELELTVEAGEFVVFVGASGCGKSTTLRMIAGLETPTAGRILIAGKDVTQIPPPERDIAMVFQSYALYPHMSVRKNMEFGLKIAGVPRAEMERRVTNAARILGLDTLLDRKPSQLSGGQRQRVAMGRAIVREPKIFLFDEPLSNLDAKLRGQMRIELALLHQRLGKTSIYVTHDQVEAMTLADRIVVFDKGFIQQVGTPDEVFNRPANTFVAAFIGSPTMNLLRGELASDNGRLVAMTSLGSIVLRPELEQASTMVRDREIIVGVRPHNVHLAEAADNAAPLHVDVAEFLGVETTLVAHPATGSPTEAVTVCVPGNRSALAGATGHFVVDPAAVHLFEAASGRNLAA